MTRLIISRVLPFFVTLVLTSAGSFSPFAQTQPPNNVLPSPLSLSDEKTYRQVFSLQERGKWSDADKKLKTLGDSSLLGHVIAQRLLHPTKYRSKYKELADWLEQYADHPDAYRIYRLALKRQPKKSRGPRKPAKTRLVSVSNKSPRNFGTYYRLRKAGISITQSSSNFHRQVRRLIRRERLTLAGKFIDKAQRQGQQLAHIGIARSRLAAGWFYYGNDEKALQEAIRASESASHLVPLAWWYGGLAAFRLGEFALAANQFEVLAHLPDISGAMRAAAAFWAGRANLIAKKPSKSSVFFQRAAKHSFEFYGILSTYILGIKKPIAWEGEIQTDTQNDFWSHHPATRRAIRLVQIGQMFRAERELRQLVPERDETTRKALLAAADVLSMPGLALQVAQSEDIKISPLKMRGLYPIPPWKPSGGYKVDRALLYAFMRQESAFRTKAKSRAGATGLMQLMPSTATYIGKRGYRGKNLRRLFEPELNIELGQKYLIYLTENEAVGNNLFFLAAAYNGGPGNLKKWMRNATLKADPLLFIESLPSRETRNFIEKVIANLWIYRDRLNQDSPSLHTLAEGNIPTYIALD